MGWAKARADPAKGSVTILLELEEQNWECAPCPSCPGPQCAVVRRRHLLD